MKKHTLLSIATAISLIATQSMPMATMRSFFSEYMPTYGQALNAIKSAPAVLVNNTHKHKALTTLALLSAATCALPQTRKAIARGARAGLRTVHSLLKRTYEKASLNGQLLNAAKKGYPRIARILIAAKANINTTKPSNDKTPLHLAAKYGHLDVVKVLIASHADITAKDYESKTPLHHAAKYGHLDIVNALLAAGADHALQDCFGKTPLRLAIEQKYFDIAEVLIDAGASTEGINLQASGYDAYIRTLALK